jgi:dephospho-CoA kinase
MSKFNQLCESILGESINDKNLFKAVIFAGGPGSGKSFINELIFDGSGAMIVSLDELFEIGSMYNHLFKDPNLTGEIAKIRKLKKQIKAKKVKIPTDSYYTPAMQNFRDAVVRTITAKRAAHWMNGMLPLVIDGTGKNVNKVANQKRFLESIGYDVSMIYVNTDMETALKRNNERERRLKPKEVQNQWNVSQSTIPIYQKMFGKDFHILDNNTAWDIKSPEFKKYRQDLWKVGNKILRSPLRNDIGKFVIDELKDTGGKYYMDLNPDFVGGASREFQA